MNLHYKRKELKEQIRKISEVLYKLDPVGLKSPHSDEYNSEALDILCKLDSHVAFLNRVCSPEIFFETFKSNAELLIKQVFRNWFDQQISDNIDFKLITEELLKVYIIK